MRAVAEVEAPRGAFEDDPVTGRPRPTILFERHYLHRLTGGRYDGLKVPSVAEDLRKRGESDREAIISLASQGGYGLFRYQHPKLAFAAGLCRRDSGSHDAAMKSASWGMFQIMGLFHDEAGHPTIQSFVNAMYRGADEHLAAFVALLRKRGLDVALRYGRYEDFFARYNGRAWRRMGYGDKFHAALLRWELRLRHREEEGG